jgi:two-component system, NtrC family, response regulator GlrR
MADPDDDLLDLSEPADLALATAASPSPTREHALVRRFTLSVVGGPDAGGFFASSQERCVIGTHPSAQLKLADRTVSRFHCELQLDGGRVIVRDLDSKNGTRVDGVAVTVAPLRPRAILHVGDNQIRFELGDEDVRIPLSDRSAFGGAVGAAPAMRAMFAILEHAAKSDATVLLQGETGVGKDVLAEGIHHESQRASGPLVVVDCAAMPPALLESELFGHEKGAFTGADVTRTGAFEAAHGGSLFLDEIGELDLELQPKLLRVLERRDVQRVGANARRAVDVRVIAATSRDLKVEVNAGRFRSDLFYRLAVVQVTVPPLRERKEDLPLLASRLLDGFGAKERAPALLTPSFLAGLARHEWPGNVRELRNYLERCLAVSEPAGQPPPGDGERAGKDTLPPIDVSRPLREAREAWMVHFERRYLSELLARHGQNVTAAARAAGLGRMQFYRLLKRCGLK